MRGCYLKSGGLYNILFDLDLFSYFFDKENVYNVKTTGMQLSPGSVARDK